MNNCLFSANVAHTYRFYATYRATDDFLYFDEIKYNHLSPEYYIVNSGMLY